MLGLRVTQKHIPLLFEERMLSSVEAPAIAPRPSKSDTAEPVKQSVTIRDVVFILHESGDGELDAVQFEEPHMFSPPKASGYAPLHLGQQIVHLDDIPAQFREPEPGEGDYEIVRKLGWGQEGSVWLARELDDSYEPSFVAIKVLTSRVTGATGRKESFELPALDAIEDGDLDHPGRQHCTLLLDVFLYRSLHGPHFCLVFEPLSASLYDYVEVVRSGQEFGFPIDGLRNIIRQVLLAVSYVHSNGFIHTDIKSDNIFIDFGEQNEAIAKYLAEHPSSTYPARHKPSISPDPIITVVSEPLPPFGLLDRNDLRLKLGDFGAAIPMEESLTFSPPLASGELLHKLDFTTLPALRDLGQRISELGVDPESRPSAEELLRDPFLTD
ncbi:hypothetical protein H1R20_g4978, partial [Candolleomyces eurysporus]